MTTVTAVRTAPASRLFLTVWSALGVAAGVGLTYGAAAVEGATMTGGTTTSTPATAVGVAALCYLAAAATRTRWVSWLGVPVFGGLAFAGPLGVLPWWVLFAVTGLVLLVVGVLAGAGRIAARQAAAMLGYFGVAVLALDLAPRVGLALAGVALAAHTVWDIHHYRHNAVVSRSLAVWCIGFDLTVGACCVAVAVLG